MREIVSPLFGIRSPFGSIVNPYKVAGFSPEYVADFERERYRVGGAGTSFSNALTATATTNRTMVTKRKWSAGNLLTYSEQFDNAAWVKSAATVTANAAVAPDGTTTADKVIATAAAGGHFVYQTNSVALTEGRFAVYAKADEYDNLRIIELASFHYYASFDLTNGTVSATGGTFFVSASATAVGDGWYLCEIVTDKTSIGTPAVMGFPDGSEPTTGPASYTGDGSSGIFVWGAHAYRSDRGGMQNASDGTTYVPTTDTAVEQFRVDDDSGVGEIVWAPHNLLTYSEQFDNAAWTNDNTTDASSSVEAPGGIALQQIVETAATGAHSIFNTTGTNSISGVSYTQEFVVRKGDGATAPDWVQVTFASGTHGTSQYANFNISTGVVGNSAGGTASIESLGGGFYRLSFTANATAAASLAAVILFTDDTDVASRGSSYAGAVTSDFYAGMASLYRSDLGGMVNNPDRGDSYVPTTSAAVYLPRRGHHVYNGTSWVNEGILVEPTAATNLLTYSEDFTNAAWTKGASTTTRNAAGPDGLSNSATTFEASSATTDATIRELVTVATSTFYTLSCFAKAGTADFLSFALVGFTTPAGVPRAYFNVSSGTIGTVSAGFDGGATIESLGNGWYRCSVSFTTDSSDTNGDIYLVVTDADNNSSASAGANVLIYGAQFEAGSVPSSYIPTAGSTATRAAETLTVDSANLPWPTPNVIGPELVTNGTFDTDTDWTKIGDSVISGGAATLTGDGALTFSAKLRQDLSLVSGNVYLLSFDVTAINSICSLSLASEGSITRQYDFDSTGTKTVALVASGSWLNINATFATSSCTIDNISVREIDPLAVSIAMELRATYADTNKGFNTGSGGPLGEFCPVDWRISDANYITISYTTATTQTGRPSFFQEDADVVDFVLGADDAYSPGINVPIKFASRHGSTFINGAVDGTALTANTTPTALADLSATDLTLAESGGPMIISKFRVWAADLGDTGIAEASS